MNPIQMPHNNMVLKAPNNWDADENGECKDLHITQVESIVYSYWRPTWKERFKILFGGHIRLAVVSYSHPPVWIDCDK